MNRSASMLSVLGLALSLGTVLMTLACGGTDVVSKGVQPVFSGSYDVSTNSVACYWEGTLRTDLAGGTGSVSSHAYSPSASVQGYIYTPGTWNDGSKTYACYWTGTTRTDLTATDAVNTYATSITVSGSDIYVGGFYTKSGADDTYIPCYWENSVFKTFGSETESARVTGIGVSGSTVYCSGYYLNGTDPVACYWDSPTKTRHNLKLSDDSTVASKAVAHGIIVANDTPWIVGHYTSDGKTVPCCWKGTKAYVLSLPSGAGNADVYAIATKGSDSSGYLYCAGYYSDGTKDVPIYWGINNVEHSTPELDGYSSLSAPSAYSARAYALFSSGDDLWIGGNYNNGSIDIPHYWKKGSGTGSPKLPDDQNQSARIACGPDVP